MKILSRSATISTATGLCLLAAIATAQAAPPKQFIAVINGPQEAPPSPVASQGVGHLTFDSATAMLCYSISYQGLSGPEILAHIHGPALPGVSGGIVFPLPLGSAKSGCVGPLAPTQKKELLKGLYYINIHSVAFPGGEIRGQILKVR